MNRNNFIKNFNIYFQKNESKFFHFNIEIKDFSSEVEFNEKLYQIFIPFFEKINIKNKYEILEKVENNKQYDAYYEEDNPDSEFCSFACKININHLYDVIKKVENYHQVKIEVFRIEDKEKQGLYNTFFSSLAVDENHHPNPREDSNFKGIFDQDNNDYKYFKKWSFGFNDLNDLENWLMNQENQKKVQDTGCLIKKITIDRDFVISGNKQLIFQMEEKIIEEIIDWKKITKDKLKKLKL